MTSSLRQIVEPSNEPISLETARLHLRLDATGSPPAHPDDPLILGLITAAREHLEKFTCRILARRSFRLSLDAFSDQIDLPLTPVAQVESVNYSDADGIPQVLDETIYTFDAGYESHNQNLDAAPLITLNSGEEWPETSGGTGCVWVDFSAGYDSAGESPSYAPIPQALISAMLLTIGALYENREDIGANTLAALPYGAEWLARPYRLCLGFA